MATQKDLFRAAVLSGAVEGMSVSEEVIDLNVSATLPEHGLHVTSPITGYCAIRVISTKGVNQGGTPWFSLEHLRGTENFNGSWFATGGVATERVKRFTGMCGSMELLRTSRRTSAFTHTSGRSFVLGGAYA